MDIISKQVINKAWKLQDDTRITLLKQIEETIIDEQPWRSVSHHDNHLTLWLDHQQRYPFDVYNLKHSPIYTCDFLDTQDHAQDIYSFAVCVTAISIVKQLNIFIKNVGNYNA